MNEQNPNRKVVWSEELREVVEQFQYDERLVFPPSGLPRDLQEQVETIIEMAGGHYNKRDKGFVFLRQSPWTCIHGVLVSNFGYDQTSADQITATPQSIGMYIVKRLDVQRKMCLEPSAGAGNIVYQLVLAHAEMVRAIEINKSSAKLCSKVVECTHQDFLDLDPMRYKTKFDCVAMHPPRTRGQDIKHLLHALEFCKPGAKVACILPTASLTRRELQKLRLLEHVEFLPTAFKCSGKPFPTACVFGYK